jgi:hypothetical protein
MQSFFPMKRCLLDSECFSFFCKLSSGTSVEKENCSKGKRLDVEKAKGCLVD